ncbi:MAG: RHS repeat protein [Leptolyngbya sp. SIOISBB]|nr:RHS repeat protein [Leptolyngbya sp. SIOISBB]
MWAVTTPLFFVDYTYDDAGNKTSVEEHSGRYVEYTYDELYRLTQ